MMAKAAARRTSRERAMQYSIHANVTALAVAAGMGSKGSASRLTKLIQSLQTNDTPKQDGQAAFMERLRGLGVKIITN